MNRRALLALALAGAAPAAAIAPALPVVAKPGIEKLTITFDGGAAQEWLDRIKADFIAHSKYIQRLVNEDRAKASGAAFEDGAGI